jgi:hypothetical protein
VFGGLLGRWHRGVLVETRGLPGESRRWPAGASGGGWRDEGAVGGWGVAGEVEATADGHPGVYLGGGGLLPVVMGAVRQAGGLVRVRWMTAPATAERHRRLVGMPTDPNRPGVSSRVVHQIGPPMSGRGARPGP